MTVKLASRDIPGPNRKFINDARFSPTFISACADIPDWLNLSVQRPLASRCNNRQNL